MNGLSIKAYNFWVLLKAVFTPETKFLLLSADTWSFWIIESLFVVTLRIVNVLEFKPIFFSSLSLGENKAKALRETFLEVEETETLFKKCLVI